MSGTCLRVLLFAVLAPGTFFHCCQAQTEVAVATEAQLLAALGTPSVLVIRQTADILLTHQSQVPGAPVNGVYVITRNVTVTGRSDPASSWLPTLDYNYVGAKVRVPQGLTFAFDNQLSTRTSRSAGYAIDFFDITSQGLLVAHDSVRNAYACPPLALIVSVLSSSSTPRPALAPGKQLARLRPSGSWCNGPAPNALLAGRCWANAFDLVDYAFNQMTLRSVVYGTTVTTQYIEWAMNTTVVCEQMISAECIQKMGLLNCTAAVLNAAVNASLTPPPPPPQAPLSPPGLATPDLPVVLGPAQSSASSSMSSGGASSAVIGAAVGGAVGGLLLLAALLLVAFFIVRRRRTGQQTESSSVSGVSKSSRMHAELHSDKRRFLGLLQQRMDDCSGSPGVTPADSTSSAAMGPPVSGLRKQLSGSNSNGAICITQQSGSLDPLNTGQSSTLDLINELNALSCNLQHSIQDNQLIIQAVIGSGAHGIVYRACWQGLPVAVKTLMFSKHALRPGGNSHGVLMEAALSKSISHPNVVATYSCDLKPVPVHSGVLAGGVSSGLQVSAEADVLNDWRLYIIQEFCDGGSLRGAIESGVLAENQRSAALSQEAVLHLATGIASGMAHLHERNVIHGDLNPANVLLKRLEAPAGRPHSSLAMGCTAKVCDFGFSVHLPANMSHVSNTRRGTPFYVAPEVEQHGNLTKAADVFAMGVILWELCVGKSVWKASGGSLVLRDSFPRLPSSAPAAYGRLMSACLSHQHAKRPTFTTILAGLMVLQSKQSNALLGSAAATFTPSSLLSTQGGSSSAYSLGSPPASIMQPAASSQEGSNAGGVPSTPTGQHPLFSMLLAPPTRTGGGLSSTELWSAQLPPQGLAGRATAPEQPASAPRSTTDAARPSDGWRDGQPDSSLTFYDECGAPSPPRAPAALVEGPAAGALTAAATATPPKALSLMERLDLLRSSSFHLAPLPAALSMISEDRTWHNTPAASPCTGALAQGGGRLRARPESRPEDL